MEQLILYFREMRILIKFKKYLLSLLHVSGEGDMEGKTFGRSREVRGWLFCAFSRIKPIWKIGNGYFIEKI